MELVSIARMVCDADTETVDRQAFGSLPSVRLGYYIRNGELFVGFDDTDSVPF